VDTPSEGGPVKIDLGGLTYTVTTDETDLTKTNQAQNTVSQKKGQLSKSNAAVIKGESAVNPK